MKICITSTGKDLNSPVDPRFGRCQFFLIGENENFKAFPNPGANYGGGAGVAAAQAVVSQRVKTVITGNVGPNAFAILNQAKIRIYAVEPSLTGNQAKEALEKNQLQKVTSPARGGCGPGMAPRGPLGEGRGFGQVGQGRNRGQRKRGK